MGGYILESGWVCSGRVGGRKSMRVIEYIVKDWVGGIVSEWVDK